MRVEAVAFFRLIGSFDAIAVELARGDTSNPDMPDLTGPMSHGIQINDLARRSVAWILIELRADTGGVTAEHSEINPVSVLMCTPRLWISRLHVTLLRRCCNAVRPILLYRYFSHQAPPFMWR